MFLKR
jgi:hypothetical protein